MGRSLTKNSRFADGALLVKRQGGKVRIVFNRPDRMNAMNLAMWDALGDVTETLAQDSEVRIVTFEGAGDRAFVAGADIVEFDEVRSNREGAERYDHAVYKALDGIASLPVPSIALVDGYCIGGGLEIALSCDLRIAADSSTFAFTPAKLGLGISYDGVALIERVAGALTAADLLFSGRRVRADEAYQMRICNRVLPSSDFWDACRAAVDEIAANAPLTIRAIKAALIDLRRNPSQRDRSRIDTMAAACVDSADYREGRAAFVEKRKPDFKGY